MSMDVICELKRCTGCGDHKPRSEFYARNDTGDGLAYKCRACAYIATKSSKAKRPDLYRQIRKRSGKKHRWKFSEKFKAKYRANALKKYGLTVADYEEMLQRQGGVCAICKSIGSRRLDVDHDHETGKVRGLLCALCNKAIGGFKDSVALLNAAAEYLTRSSSTEDQA